MARFSFLLSYLPTRPIVIVFYLSAVVLLAMGFYLCRKIPASSKSISRRERKSFGHFFMLLSILPFALGVITQFYSSNESDADLSSGYDFTPRIIPAHKVPLDQIPEVRLPPEPAAGDVGTLLHDAVQNLELRETDEAMTKVNAAFQIEPKNWATYYVRGNIYALKRQWDLAEKDYQMALQINGPNPSIQYNMADIQFLQKQYDAARPGFLALEDDPTLGDQCAYKVFLCDLYAGHEDIAGKELDAFNQVGANASYYFANVAWSLSHQKLDDARTWLTSAEKIYEPVKFKRYTASLTVLGYPDKLTKDSPEIPSLSVPDLK